MAPHPQCEYLDVSDRQIEIAVRLPGEDCPAGSRYRLSLRHRNGREVAWAAAEIGWRVSSIGGWTRSSLRFTIAPSTIPNGSYRLELRPEGAAPSTWVEPSSGLMAGSRPRSVGSRRMQAFPAAGKAAVWIRFAETTTVARAFWGVRNVVRDVAFVAHTRRFTWVRIAKMLTTPLVPAAPIWLIGERPETARDNGRALFAYLRRVRPESPVFYVITAESGMREVVEPLGNVVIHSSIRHRLLMLHADVLANAYSIKHMLPRGWHPGAYMAQASWRLGAVRVYLKHGVHLSPYALKRANGGYDLVATVGSRETAALGETSGYGEQLVETGLARYDDLASAAGRSNVILFMPTWRRYLVPKLFGGAEGSLVAFDGSTYQRFIDELLISPRLAQLLDDYDLTFAFLPHYNLASLIELPSGLTRRIELLEAATADIPALLRTCDLLLTDYSSVQFDVAYVGTPVVYCRFDEEEFVSGHGASSWFETESDGFGPITVDVESTVDAIARYADRAFEREGVYDERAAAIFAHRDDQNCERLVAAIDALPSVRSGGAV